ncbi:MAG TPA: hypothetical protein OIM45_01500 [Clostridiaceae bacterium]|nr:hypothetical protein [Clostridiaceae bacterium]
MEQLKEQFPIYTPDYVLDEVAYYFQKIARGGSDVFTLDNAISLVNLAIVNERINDEQGDIIKNKIRDIKNKQIGTL